MFPYANREEAGKFLASKLEKFLATKDLLVLGLTRGGVPVAWEVAEALDAPLDIIVVRKLGYPGQEELAMGAIAADALFLNRDIINQGGISESRIRAVIEREKKELDRRERLYRQGLPGKDIAGKTVIIVDDGLATGASMRVAAQSVRNRNPRRVIIAVPVAAPSTCQELEVEANEVICARTPEPFRAVGLWYQDFRQTTDKEVEDIMAKTVRQKTPSDIVGLVLIASLLMFSQKIIT
jgi:putative phosphoribosyl transferase